jgi:phage terminase large subunit GpA-like protein
VNTELQTAFEPFWFTESERLIFKPKENIGVADWAERHLFLGRGERFNLELVPYARGPLEMFKLPWVRKILLEWAPQTGKTATAKACLSYCVDIDPGPAMYIMPDEKVTRRISRRQLKPMFKMSPRLSELLGERADDVTTLEFKFRNGMDLLMAWASSAASIASESIRYLFFDEPGKYPEWSGKEADPFSLAEQRQNRYEATSKQMFFSTPNLADDPFDKLLETEPDETFYYHARCPYCGKLQVMNFEDIHALDGSKDHNRIARLKLARYSCVNCKMDWDDHARNRAVAAGRWIAESPVERPLAVAFRGLASWYSQFVSMSTGLAAFFKAQEDPNRWQAFFTQHKCQAWAEAVERQKHSDLLKRRTKIPPGVLPEWAIVLTAGIDTQKRGFWYVVRAWGEDMSSHLVEYGYIEDFAGVEQLIFNTRYKIEGDGDDFMAIWRAAMDTGGGVGEYEDLSRTQEVYQFLMDMRIKYPTMQVLNGIKGASRRQLQVVGTPKTIESKSGFGKHQANYSLVRLRTIDTFVVLWSSACCTSG